MDKCCDRDQIPPFTSTTQVFHYLMERSFGLRPQADLPDVSPVSGSTSGSNPDKVIDLARARAARKARCARTKVADTHLPQGVGDQFN